MQAESKSKKMRWLKGLAVLAGGLAMFAACDDDPIVIPDTEEEECTGSYCLLEKNENDFLSLPMAFLNLKNNPETF
jgi:hypothetical protein